MRIEYDFCQICLIPISKGLGIYFQNISSAHNCSSVFFFLILKANLRLLGSHFQTLQPPVIAICS